jgi:hypothetical protein
LTKTRKKEVNIFLTNYTELYIDVDHVLVDPCRFSKYLTAAEMDELWGTDTAKKQYIIQTRLKEIARQNYPANKECGVNNAGEIIAAPASISQTINVEGVVKVVNTVYVDAFSWDDFYKSEPSPTTPPPPTEEGAPVWILVGVFIVLLLMIGTTIILSQ